MTLRSWATPLVIATFAVSGVTGILMFLHADSGLNKLAHEWIGLAMVAAVLAHLVLNWRAFTTYFRRPLAQVIMATHSPILMAVPGAQVLEITRDGLTPVDWRDTAHFRLYRDFATDPQGFLAEALTPP